jgi:hypothetical protein
MLNDQPPKQNSITRLFALPSDSDDVRVKKCLEAMTAALEQYGCELTVSIHYTHGQTIPEIKIIPA